MAAYTWIHSGTGDWATPGNWTPSGGPPGAVAISGDVANLISSGNLASFTATVGSGESFSLAVLDLQSTNAAHEVDLEIQSGGTLTTGSLSLVDQNNNQDHIILNNGGVFNIVTSITGDFNENIGIGSTGVTAGGRLELGSATSSGITVDDPSVNFVFQGITGEQNDGVVEYLSGFVQGGTTTTVQHYNQVTWGDAFVFDGANFAGDSVNYVGTTITVTGASGTLTMDNVSATAGTTFIESGNEIIAVCYARGTMVRTPDGEQPVEKLRAGKQVIALIGGQEVVKTVTWLGHRRVDLVRHTRPETVAPVRIRRDAFAEGMPHRDLIVSPDHAIFVDGKLICARQLVNGSTIRQECDWTAVDYYHVELENHAILLAEGLPAESYIDTGNSGFFENSGAPLVLHPDLTDETDYPTRQAGSCAPFVWDEASVRPIWQRLADRAASIGQPIPQRPVTTEPNLRLRGKMRERQSTPIFADSKLAIFVLPRGAAQIHLLSRAQSPTEARPWLDDRRRLGVRVQRIVLRGATELREVPMDHPDLTKGWWDIERDGQMMNRWTNGDAVIPLPKMDGHVMLEVHLAGEMIYAVDTEVSDTERAAA
jgi:hypothetical protein